MTRSKLTKVQQRILDALPTDGSYTDAYKVCRQRRTRMALNNSGVTEPMCMGAMVVWYKIRPTALGLSFRKG